VSDDLVERARELVAKLRDDEENGNAWDSGTYVSPAFVATLADRIEKLERVAGAAWSVTAFVATLADRIEKLERVAGAAWSVTENSAIYPTYADLQLNALRAALAALSEGETQNRSENPQVDPGT
jgi:hypothetical protein